VKLVSGDYLATHQSREAVAEFQESSIITGLYCCASHLQRRAMQGDCAKASGRISGLADTLERRRPRHPHPEASQGGVRETAIVAWEILRTNFVSKLFFCSPDKNSGHLSLFALAAEVGPWHRFQTSL
jgi:hypothetical protein